MAGSDTSRLTSANRQVGEGLRIANGEAIARSGGV
jgi:hypothetical protein